MDMGVVLHDGAALPWGDQEAGNRGVDRHGHALPPQQGVAKVLLRPLVVTKAGGRHAELMEDERIIETSSAWLKNFSARCMLLVRLYSSTM